LREFKLEKRRYIYDPQADTMTDLQSQTMYRAVEGFFTADDGEELYPGFKVWLGLGNYWALLRNPAVSGPFASVFLWTIAFATLSVITTFILGLFLAILLNDPYLKFRRFYRVLVIVPYALPAFISILIWHGLLNTNLGIINHVLMQLFQLKIPWLDNPMWARASIVLVNLWLGYPYMMIVSLGALQSIPGELYEAARVDGAGWFYRFFRITMPLLLMPLAPLLIGTFAFNFNNFTIIWLLTKGGPPIPGAQTPAGSTDILLSFTYRLAFEGARGNQMGLAAAVSIIIFLIIATISAINFRFTGALEDLSKNV
jgi:ABC-type sugar transport system permease subunit